MPENTITQFTAKSYTVRGTPEDPDVFIVIRPDGAPLQDQDNVPADGLVQASFYALHTDGRPVEQKFVAFLNPDGSPLSLRDIVESGFLATDQNLADVDDVATARTNLDVYSKAESDALVYSDEQAMDAIAAMLVGTGYFTLTYNDAGDELTIDLVPSALPRGIDVITEATAARVASAVDAYGYVRFTNAGATTYTIEADNDLPLESVITLRDVACTSLTIVAGAGVTINAPFEGTLVSAGNGATIQIVKVAANEYDVFGHVGAA